MAGPAPTQPAETAVSAPDGEPERLLARLQGDSSAQGPWQAGWRSPGWTVVLTANATAALAALYFGWDPFTIVLLYWLENAVIGIFNLLRIACAAPRFRTQADLLLGLSHSRLFRFPDLTKQFVARAQRLPGESMPAAKCTSLTLFLTTFVLFMALHAMALLRLFEGVEPQAVLPALAAHLSGGLLLALAGLSVEHVWSFGHEYVYERGYRRTIPLLQSVQLYPRLLVIHAALLLGGLVGQLIPVPWLTALALVALKTGLDMGLILRIPLRCSHLAEFLGGEKQGEETAAQHGAQGSEGKAATRGQNDEEPLGSGLARPPATVAVQHGDGRLVVSLPPLGSGRVSRRFAYRVSSSSPPNQRSGLLAAALTFFVIGGILFALGGAMPTVWFFTGAFRFGMGSDWPLLILPILFAPLGALLMGIGLDSLLLAVCVGHSSATLRVTKTELEVIERGLVVRRRWVARCAHVLAVDVVATGAAINHVPWLQLEIQLRDRGPRELLYGREEEELREVARLLNEAVKPGGLS